MKNKFILAALVVITPATAFAGNVGQCGWGSKAFDGQKGIAPQVLAVTTNGTSGNQTFGITFGTSGCTQSGVVRSSWKTAMYIDANMEKIARDMSVGEGESLESLALLLEIDAQDKALFFSTLKNNFASIFTSPDVTSTEVRSSLKNIIASNKTLAKYTALI